MTIIGTIRKNRVEIPPLLVEMRRKPPLHTEVVYDHRLRACMLSYVPKKRRFVTLLSTYHSSVRVNQDDPKEKPNVSEKYNETKGGVDVMDKLIGTYRSKRKVNRWPVALFEHIIDVSALNAYIIFCEIMPDWNAGKKFKRRIFLQELGIALSSPLIERRRKLPSKNAPANRLCRTIRGEPVTDEEADDRQPASLTHAPPSNKRSRCFKCPTKRSMTNYYTRCDKCVKYVCNTHHYKVCEDYLATFKQ